MEQSRQQLLFSSISSLSKDEAQEGPDSQVLWQALSAKTTTEDANWGHKGRRRGLYTDPLCSTVLYSAESNRPHSRTKDPKEDHCVEVSKRIPLAVGRGGGAHSGS